MEGFVLLDVNFVAFYLLISQIGVAKNGKYSKTGFMVTVSPLVLHNMKKLEHMKNVSENCEKEVNYYIVQFIYFNIFLNLQWKSVASCGRFQFSFKTKG